MGHKNDNNDISYFLAQLRRHKLLCAEEEVALSQARQEQLRLERVKLRLQQQRQQPISEEVWTAAVALSQHELKNRIRAGQRARTRMTQGNLRLVLKIAKKYMNRGLSLEELLQEGCIGLQTAIDRFNPAKGYKFSTYAVWWIRQGITRAVANQGNTIRTPVHVDEKIRKIKKLLRQLISKLGRMPSDTEIAEAMGITLEELDEVHRAIGIRSCRSLADPVAPDTEMTLEGMIAQAQPVMSYAEEKDLQQLLEKYVSQLKPQQQEIVRLHWGLGETKGEMLYREIASLLDCSTQNIGSQHKQAIAKLRQQMPREEFAEFLDI